MPSLKLVPAKHNRSVGQWSDDDYDVLVETGETVGLIFRQPVAPGNSNEWFWGFDLRHALAASVTPYGHAATKEAAEQAFAERWRDGRLGTRSASE